MTGKVYFASAPGRIKIGFTKHPDRRLAQLRSADMETIEVIGIIDGARYVERKLHYLLHEYRRNGEWFEDCPEVRAVIADAMAGNVPKPPAKAEVQLNPFDQDFGIDLLLLPILDARQALMRLEIAYYELANQEIERRKLAGIAHHDVTEKLRRMEAGKLIPASSTRQ